jgi:chromosome segregation ATPase
MQTILSQQHALREQELNHQLLESDRLRLAAENEAQEIARRTAVQIQDLQTELSLARQRNSDSQSRYQDSLLKLSQVETQLDIAQRKNNETDSMKRELGGIIRSQQGKISELVQQIADLEQLYENKNKELNEKLKVGNGANRQIKTLTLNLTQKQAQVKELEAKLKKIGMEHQHDQTKANESHDKILQLSREYECAKTALLVKDKLLEDNTITIQNLKANLSAKVNEFKEIQRENENVKEIQYEVNNLFDEKSSI